MTKKVEVNEDDLKKVILILELSTPFLHKEKMGLRLTNLWRIHGKLTKRFLKQGNLCITTNSKGQVTIKGEEDAKEV